jgi:hypothetical protein
LEDRVLEVGCSIVFEGIEEIEGTVEKDEYEQEEEEIFP